VCGWVFVERQEACSARTVMDVSHLRGAVLIFTARGSRRRDRLDSGGEASESGVDDVADLLAAASAAACVLQPW
jgi:hypothetical protein